MHLTLELVFAWCMSFSIVVNFKELLFHMWMMCLWIWLNTSLKRRRFPVSMKYCQKTSRFVKVRVDVCVWSFWNLISNNTQNSFFLSNSKKNWHKISVNAYKMTFLFFLHVNIVVFVLYLNLDTMAVKTTFFGNIHITFGEKK